jgi:hypothetical protein
MEPCRVCVRAGVKRGHCGVYDPRFDKVYGICPYNPESYNRCPSCFTPIVRREIYCRDCQKNYKCINCLNITLKTAPEENLQIRKCTKCAIFYTCDLCKMRKYASGPRTRCHKCELGHINCIECSRKFVFGSLEYPWHRYYGERCLRCIPWKSITRTQTKILWLLCGRRAGLLKIVADIILTAPCELVFDDAVRLYLIFEQRYPQFCTIPNRLESYKRFLANRSAADLVIRECVDFEYIFIFFARWLPRDIILLIASYISEPVKKQLTLSSEWTF